MTLNLDARLNPQAPAVLSLFRVIIGLLFLCHATSHLFGWPVAAQQAPVGTWPFWFAGVLELVSAVLIIVGLFTRIAAFVASGVMAFAFFTQHLPGGIIPMTNGGELAVLYCFGFFLLVFTGGGLYALDSRRRSAGRVRVRRQQIAQLVSAEFTISSSRSSLLAVRRIRLGLLRHDPHRHDPHPLVAGEGGRELGRHGALAETHSLSRPSADRSSCLGKANLL